MEKSFTINLVAINYDREHVCASHAYINYTLSYKVKLHTANLKRKGAKHRQVAEELI